MSKMDKYYKRSGIVPYFQKHGLYAFGFNRDYGTLIDFGGTIEEGENEFQTAAREYNEESFGVFGKIRSIDLEGQKMLYYKNNTLFFVFCELEPDEVSYNFNERLMKEKEPENHEIQGIVFLSGNDIKDILANEEDVFFYRTRETLIFGEWI